MREIREEAEEELLREQEVLKVSSLREEDYYYQVLSDGTVEITDYVGKATELVVLEEITGRKMTSSRDEGFSVLEFLGLDEKAKYVESDLETAIINKLQKFLLELGKGYLFEARQKRFTFNEDNYYVDLVFYNRILRCYVLIDLKIDKLTHQDLGQMMMYVNYYDRYEKLPEENLTVGILLCKEKDDALVEITLPDDANIYASEYQLYLPDKKELQKKLKEWIEEGPGIYNIGTPKKKH